MRKLSLSVIGMYVMMAQAFSQVTAALCDRWQPGARLLPANSFLSGLRVVIHDLRVHRFACQVERGPEDPVIVVARNSG